MPKWLEVIGVILLPLAYGLAVSAFFHWLHRRRAAADGKDGANGEGAK